MILNVWSVTAFFLAAVGGALALVTLGIALRGLARLRTGAGGAALGAGEERAHLLALALAVLAGVRLLAWPHFYLLLKSYVPALSGYGVMCAFGVTRTQPGLVAGLQWLKPVLLLALGFWMLLELVDRRTAAPVLLRARFALALPLALLALAESGLELLYLVREKVGRPVTCCTQFLDSEAARISERASLLPRTLFESGAGALALYVAIQVLAIAGALWLWRSGLGATRRTLGGVALAATGLFGLVLARQAWVEVLAPRVLRLPYHHCVYELLTDTPALGLAAALAVLGSGALLWPLGLQPWRRVAPEPVAALQRGAYGMSAVALASSLLVVAVHLV